MSRALTMDEAADNLRVSRRWLEYWLAAHPVDTTGNPFYVPMGRRKTFGCCPYLTLSVLR